MKKLYFCFFSFCSSLAKANSIFSAFLVCSQLVVPVGALFHSSQSLFSDGKKITLANIGSNLEKRFGNLSEYPQYRYIAIPVYKNLGGRNHPLISVPASFAATDIIMHRLPAQLVAELLAQLYSFQATTVYRNEIRAGMWSMMKIVQLPGLLGWVLLSIPVAWHKYKKLSLQ